LIKKDCPSVAAIWKQKKRTHQKHPIMKATRMIVSIQPKWEDDSYSNERWQLFLDALSASGGTGRPKLR